MVDRTPEAQAGPPRGPGVLAPDFDRLRRAAAETAEQLAAWMVFRDPGAIRRAMVRWTFLHLARQRGFELSPRIYDRLEHPDVHARLGSKLFEPEREAVFGDVPPEPSSTLRAALDEGPWPEEALGVVFEAAASADQRKAKGVHYTPPELAETVVERTLGPLLESPTPPTVCDPACGSGAFLLAAARKLSSRHGAKVAFSLLHGVDLDPWAVEVARLSLWLARGQPELRSDELEAHLVVGDALLGLGRPEEDLKAALQRWTALTEATETALHWPVEFPDVMGGPRVGFDAVIGNPPFINSIEGHGRRDEVARRLHRLQWPDFCHGAYDAALAFWARALVDLLGPEGRFGLIAPSVSMSDSRPWKAWMLERCPVEWLRTLPVDHFPGAKVRTLAAVGQAARIPAALEFENLDPSIEAPERGQRKTSGLNWYAALVDFDPPVTTRTLADVAELHAGCTTADAYALSVELVDARDTEGQKLITTGAIDRFHSWWGSRKTRYLRQDLLHPRWPGQPKDAGLGRALERQRRPKILVGGLTAIIEAWIDRTGGAAGVVQTWVIHPSASAGLDWTAAILNSACFSRIYVSRHGAESMTGRQITIRKRALAAMPVPEPRVGEPSRHLAEAAKRLERSYDADLDRLLHLSASLAYGRSLEQAEDDYQWWCRRARCAPRATPYPELTARLG